MTTPQPSQPAPPPQPITIAVPLSYDDFTALDRYSGASRPARNPQEHAAALLLVSICVMQASVLRYIRGETATLEIVRPAPYALRPGEPATDVDVVLRPEDLGLVRMLAGGDDRAAWAAILGGLLRDAVAPFRAEALAALV
jgi:hypothetical protein